MQAPARDTRIPVTVLTGFLGAGKTTLLNHWVRQPRMRDVALLINEFGEVGIDHLLVEQVADDMVLLDSGCICCTVRGDLKRALTELLRRRRDNTLRALSRVVIETTGLADPVPVVHAIKEEFCIRYRLDGVVTAVDVTHIDGQLSAHPEAVRQVAMADRLLLTKCDLATPAQIGQAGILLARLNPGAEQIDVRNGRCDVSRVLGIGPYDVGRKSADVKRWLGEETALRRPGPFGGRGSAHAHHHHDVNRHDAHVEAHVLRFAQPFKWAEFAKALESIQTTHGDRILRVKGLVRVTKDPRPVVVQGVGFARYPIAFLEAWPDEDTSTRLVFIVRDLDRETLVKAFRLACRVEPLAAPV